MSNQSEQAYPLQWPAAWVRTKPADRQVAPFRKTATMTIAGKVERSDRRVSNAEASDRLEKQLLFLGGHHAVLSTNLELRLNGLPRSGQAEPSDVGAAIYFTLDGQRIALACDRWNRVADNIAALAAHIDALRRIDRYGVGTAQQAFRGYAALPPPVTMSWRDVFGSGVTTLAEVEKRYRELAAEHHPDKPGGSHVNMVALNAAIEAARKELS